MNFAQLLWLLALLAALPSAGDAQSLVRDFNTTPPAGPESSFPAGFTPLLSGELLFVAESRFEGSELWKTDGTPGGTQLLKDIAPGSRSSSPRDLVRLSNGSIAFTADTAADGRELWITDGTSAGTRVLADIHPGSLGSQPEALTTVGSALFFSANDGVHGRELWASNGTSAGTQLVVDLQPGPGSGVALWNTSTMARLGTSGVVFIADASLGYGLWKSDGTAAGTTSVTSPVPTTFGPPLGLTALGSRVLYQTPDPASPLNLWATDGTLGGTQALGVDAALHLATVVQGSSTLYFAGSLTGNQWELWRTDGTPAGTSEVANLLPDSITAPGELPALIGSVGSTVLFSATDDGMDYDLYSTDGTSAGTLKISEVSSLLSLNGPNGAQLGGSLFFQGVGVAPEGLWASDGTAAGTRPIDPIESSYSQSGVTNGQLLFAGTDSLSGTELWSTSGIGAQLVQDIHDDPVNLGSDPALLLTHRDLALVHVDDGVVGREPWVSDGTNAGTQLLVDAAPGPASSELEAFASNGRFLFFGASTPTNRDPWISDGTPNGTTRIPVGSLFPGFRVLRTEALGDRFVLFAATDALGAEPWITDGTLAGTQLLADVHPGPTSSNPRNLYVHEGRAYFVASSPVEGYEPWVTDGTSGGTFRLGETAPGLLGTATTEFAGLGDQVFFRSGTDSVGGSELWRTDGTAAGTTRFADIAPGPDSSVPGDFRTVGDRLVFQANLSPTQPRVLLSTNGIGGNLVNFHPSRVEPDRSNRRRQSARLTSVQRRQPRVLDDGWRLDHGSLARELALVSACRGSHRRRGPLRLRRPGFWERALPHRRNDARHRAPVRPVTRRLLPTPAAAAR